MRSEVFRDKRALHYAMSPKLSVLLNLQFVVRKRVLYEMCAIKAFKYM